MLFAKCPGVFRRILQNYKNYSSDIITTLFEKQHLAALINKHLRQNPNWQLSNMG